MSLIRCKECGTMVSDHAQNCPKCGTPLTKIIISGKQLTNQRMAPAQPAYAGKDQKSSNIILIIFSLLIPIVGWILYFVYKDKDPVKAKSCAKFAWIGFAINLAIILLPSLLFI